MNLQRRNPNVESIQSIQETEETERPTGKEEGVGGG